MELEAGGKGATDWRASGNPRALRAEAARLAKAGRGFPGPALGWVALHHPVLGEHPSIHSHPPASSKISFEVKKKKKKALAKRLEEAQGICVI